MRTVRLNGRRAAGRVAIVSDEDYELVSGWNWHIYYNKTAGPYAIGAPKGAGRGAKQAMMHTLITGYAQTDHVNHDGLDNQRHNLRPATHAENQWNGLPQTGKSSRFKGVCWVTRDRRWLASIRVNRKTHYLGEYRSEEDAARAYDAAAREMCGEFACLNFPEEYGERLPA